jgi:hypothetical protein
MILVFLVKAETKKAMHRFFSTSTLITKLYVSDVFVAAFS